MEGDPLASALDPLVLVPSWALAALAAALTCRLVWRGGRSWNDHAVAAVVTGCIALYPGLVHLAAVGGYRLPWLAAAMLPGPWAIYGLFHAMETRRDPGPFWGAVAKVAQPAMAFSLWTGLLLCFYLPISLVVSVLWPQAAAVLRVNGPWPGPWLSLPLALTAAGTVWTYRRGFTIRHNAVRIRDVSTPVRVVQLSDIHASPAMLRADIRELARRVTELKPDLVAVTGDHVMPFSEQEHGFLVEELAAMGLPTVACLGNHDLPVAARLVDEFRAAGMRILVDESTVVEVAGRRLEVVGVTFHWRQARDKFLSVLDALPPPPSDARLLLAHDPRLFAWLPAGRFHLVLSGHTHGGQVGTDMFGVPWSVLRPLGLYDQGRFDRDGTALWVHRGNWHTGLPPRMGIAGEIVVHEVYA